MSLTNDDLLAISQLLDVKLDSKFQAKLQPLKDDIRDIKLHLENVTDKNIQLLAENYVPAAKCFSHTDFTPLFCMADFSSENPAMQSRLI